MPSESKDAKPTSPGRQGRSKSMKEGGSRSGNHRSRSPSAYLRKKGKSMRGLFSSGDKKGKDGKSSSKGAQTETAKPNDKIEADNVEKDSASTTQAEDATSSEDKKDAGEADKSAHTTASNDLESLDTDAKMEEQKIDQELSSDESADGRDSRTEGSVNNVENSPKRQFASEAFTESETPETPVSAASPTRDNVVTVVSPYSPTSNSIAAVPSLDAEETVQIILLLMDLQTRRFELLQLEFDPNLAVVNDILAQIPDAATEHVLRTQPYEGICSVDGTEMPSDVRLDTCVTRENEVKIAIPSGITGRECAKLAFPILNDTKVRSMLGPDALPKDLRSLIGADDPQQRVTKKMSSGDRIEKILSGEGSLEQNSRSLSPSEPSKSRIRLIFLIVASLALLLLVNTYLTMSLQRGTSLHAGGYLRKCGLWSFTLEDFNGCSEMVAEFDGDKMQVYRMGTMFGDKELVYSVVPETEKGGDGSSRLEFADDGKITISGKKILVVTEGTGKEQHSEIRISPWPFANAGVLKKVRRKGKKTLFKIE